MSFMKKMTLSLPLFHWDQLLYPQAPKPGPKMGLPASLTWPGCVLHNRTLVNGSRTPGDLNPHTS
ncbi:hypothetical protein EK904_007916 [Melospiza melodia maxima]|nr:hypothetical protein EK904_007916 [Melospiza melodia maxima]